MLCTPSLLSEIDAELARQIAHGTVDPVTRTPYPPELLGELTALLSPAPSPLRTGTPRQTRSHDIAKFFAAAATAAAATEPTTKEPETPQESTPTMTDEGSDAATLCRRRLGFVVLSRFFALPPPEQLARLQPCEVVCPSAEDSDFEGDEDEDEEECLGEQKACKRARDELDALQQVSDTDTEGEEDTVQDYGDEGKNDDAPSPPPAPAADTGTPDIADTAEETAPRPQDRALALDSLDMFLCD